MSKTDLLYRNHSTRSGSTVIKGLQYCDFCIIKLNRKMDATPSFGVTMISEVPSNPQLTLASLILYCPVRKVFLLFFLDTWHEISYLVFTACTYSLHISSILHSSSLTQHLVCLLHVLLGIQFSWQIFLELHTWFLGQSCHTSHVFTHLSEF